MKQKLTRILKIIISDARQAYVPAILLFVVGGTGSIFLLYEKALTWSIQTINTPTPLWATIALVLLCCGYIYLKAQQHIPKTSPLDNPPTTLLVEIGNFKWQTDIIENGSFKIHPIPYCKTHEIKHVSHQNIYICPAIQLGCKSIIEKSDLKLQQDVANSFIEHMRKNKKDMPTNPSTGR